MLNIPKYGGETRNAMKKEKHYGKLCMCGM